MKAKSFKLLATLVTALLIASNTLNAQTSVRRETRQEKNRRPNIIFILVDDLGWSELGVYGNRFNETPNLDELARGGMRFTSAYAAAPVCSPTRAALITGQYPARVGIIDYLDARDHKHLAPSYTTLNEPLEGIGYKTGLIGKWHLTGDYSVGRGAPERHGWDEVIASEQKYIAGGDYTFPYFFLPQLAQRIKPNEYLTNRLDLEAMEFIRRYKDEPFFLYLSHYSVHTKLDGKPELVKKYAAKPSAGKNRNNPHLAAMLESIDTGVGQIMRTLDELKLSDDTIIIFTSDNGGETNVTSNAPLRAGKSTLYEGGIREPLLIRYPKLVRPGTVCDEPLTTPDFYPTLLELAGARADKEQVMDGKSFVRLLRNPRARRNETLYWHYPLDKPHFLGGRSSGAIRIGDYKLIEFYDDGHLELYNLKMDLGEERNLAAEMPDRAQRMQRQLTRWRERTVTRSPRYGAPETTQAARR